MNTDFNFFLSVITFVFFIILCFSFQIIYSSYKSIIAKEIKTDRDIIKRQHLILATTLLIATVISFIPFIYCNLIGYIRCSHCFTIKDFVLEWMFFSFLLTMGVMLIDSFIRRITSDIYIYKDIQYLQNFCLYLRSFNSDSTKQEVMICRQAKHLFPVYAVGDPNNILQPNGAERIYLTDDKWKAGVEDMMNRCKVVLLRVGNTDGTLWEIEKIFSKNLVHKTIFIVSTSADYKWFQSIAPDSINQSLLKLDFSYRCPYAFFITNGRFYAILIRKQDDVEKLLNKYLSMRPELDKDYSKELELRNHYLLYLFSERIPSKVRKSVNLQFISPLIMMDKWPIGLWLFLFLFIISIYIISYLFNIPIQLLLIPLILALIILGNRIEWACGGYSCPEFFLKVQKRKTFVMWYSSLLGFFFSFLYYQLFIISV